MAWKRRRSARPGEPAYSPFIDTLVGTLYKAVWEKKEQPDPGAQAFAWETLALPAFTPTGPGVLALGSRPHAFYAPPAYAYAGTVIVGLPYIAGQYILQPLIDPNVPEGG